MKFLSSEVALYFNKSTIQPFMEYCCHVWAGGLVATWSCQTNYKNKYAGLSALHLLLLLNPLAHCQNVASLSLFYRCYFDRFSSELSQLVPFPFSQGRSTRYFDRLCGCCHHSQMLQGCLCQQFLSLHSQAQEFFAYKMLSFDL